MLQSTLISPATGSLAAIVGTPPAAQRVAGDGSPAPDSFAMALNQASSPPPPPAPPATAPAGEEPRADGAAAEAAKAETSPAPTAESAASTRAAGPRKAVTATATAVDDKSAAEVLAARSVSATAETGTGVLATSPQDTADADRPGRAGDAPPDAGSLLTALPVGAPAAADRLAGKASQSTATATSVVGAPLTARGSAASAMDAASSAATGLSRRSETGADGQTAAAERDTALRSAPAAALAPAAAPAATATAGPLPAAAPLLSAVAAGANTPTVVEARLQASPGSTEFASSLGAQLNVFLREGVQHARLHLNPAELGPLTVQIQLDGIAAQVRLAAENPMTRQALEQAMPVLAGTLRESGLTLTGGGVFEQPANPQPQQDGRASPGERAAGPREGRDPAVQADGAPVRTSVMRRGVVDLVA